MTMDSDSSECFEACRTCGIFFISNSNFLKPIFPADEPDIVYDILLELNGWNVNIKENDGLSQYICITCIKTFKDVFTFRRNCRNVQVQLLSYSRLRKEDKVRIKTEKIDPDEMDCKIIYVDDLSDTEFASPTPFGCGHIPIKEEPIEEATVPIEMTLSNADTPNFRALDSTVNLTNKLSSYSKDDRKEYEALTPSNIDVAKNSKDKKKYKCRMCPKTFDGFNLQRIKLHLKWHMINKRLVCAYCNSVFKSRKHLQTHYRIHKSSTGIRRRIHQTKTKENLRSNNDQNETIALMPKECENIEEESSDQYLIVCSKCDERFKNTSDLQKHHDLQMHKTRSNIFDDTLNCIGNGDSNRSELQSNTANFGKSSLVNMIDNVKHNTFDEDIDTMYTDSSDSNSDNENEYFCAHCTASFSNINLLRSHNEEHLNRKLFECHICNEMFNLKFILNQHIQKVHQQ